jgi:hypothetical protein
MTVRVMKPVIKTIIISLLITIEACSSMKQSIRRNQKATSNQIEKLVLQNGNAFCISATNSTATTLWSYSDDIIIIYRLLNGKLVKEESHSAVNTKEFTCDFEDELFESGCIELDGGGLHIKFKTDSTIETHDFPINTKCFTQRKYNSVPLNNLVSDINTYNLGQ